MAAAISIPLAAGGCSTSIRTEPPSRELPALPSFVSPVWLMAPREGDDLELVAARDRAGRAKANDIITCFTDWYGRLRKTYGRTDPDPELATSSLVKCERLALEAERERKVSP